MMRFVRGRAVLVVIAYLFVHPASAADLPAKRGLRSGEDLLCGAMFALVGVAALWIGRAYPMGTPLRLGSGVFPWLLSWGLIGIGGIIFAKGLLTDGPRLTGWAWRPVILITLAAISFGLLIEPAGLLVSMLVLMVLGALAGDDHSWRELSVFIAIMLVIGVTIFIWGLGMPIKVFPWS